MKTQWLVVADEAIARILEWPGPGGGLDPVEELTHPAAHAKGAELRDDAHGRRAGNDAHAAGDALRPGASATAGAGLDETHREAERFARRVAQHLDQALQQGRCDSLVLAAAPRFLGLLRKFLSPDVQAAVTLQTDKQLTHEDARSLRARFYPQGRPVRGPGPA